MIPDETPPKTTYLSAASLLFRSFSLKPAMTKEITLTISIER